MRAAGFSNGMPHQSVFMRRVPLPRPSTMRPPESSSRSMAAVAWTRGERVKALAMPLPMPIRAVVGGDGAEHREGVLVEELDAEDRVEPGLFGLLRQAQVAARRAGGEDQSMSHQCVLRLNL